MHHNFPSGFHPARRRRFEPYGFFAGSSPTNRKIPLPPIIGGIALVGGIALLVVDARKR